MAFAAPERIRMATQLALARAYAVGAGEGGRRQISRLTLPRPLHPQHGWFAGVANCRNFQKKRLVLFPSASHNPKCVEFSLDSIYRASDSTGIGPMGMVANYRRLMLAVASATCFLAGSSAFDAPKAQGSIQVSTSIDFDVEQLTESGASSSANRSNSEPRDSSGDPLDTLSDARHALPISGSAGASGSAGSVSSISLFAIDATNVAVAPDGGFVGRIAGERQFSLPDPLGNDLLRPPQAI